MFELFPRTTWTWCITWCFIRNHWLILFWFGIVSSWFQCGLMFFRCWCWLWFLQLELSMAEQRCNTFTDTTQHIFKHKEGFSFVFIERIFLSVCSKSNGCSHKVKTLQMFFIILFIHILNLSFYLPSQSIRFAFATFSLVGASTPSKGYSIPKFLYFTAPIVW